MKVLLAFDGSEASADALERTVERAAEVGDELTVAITDPEAESREALADRVESLAADTELSVTVRHVEGQPGSELVSIAESESFDEIVLGGNTTSPMGKISIDQTAEFVLLNSHITVTLVR